MARHAFANWLLGSPDKIPKILWSDESYFSLNGMINRHNCVIWSDENPSFLHAETLHSPQLFVWMGFSSECVLKPFFFPGIVNGQNYLSMLENHVIPQLKGKKKYHISARWCPSTLPQDSKRIFTQSFL
jgi:hypothetical protein